MFFFFKNFFCNFFFLFADWLCITHRKPCVTQALVGTTLLALLHARAHTSCDDKKHRGSHPAAHVSLQLVEKTNLPVTLFTLQEGGKIRSQCTKLNNQFVSLAIKLRSQKLFGLSWVEILFLSRFP